MLYRFYQELSKFIKKKKALILYGARQEIDLVEEIDGKLSAFEMKWSPKKAAKIPRDWAASYEDTGFNVINRENYLDFLLSE
jgi:hypothetical protein